MIELSQYHQGFVAGWLPGLFMGMGLMKMAWEHDNRRRRSKPRRSVDCCEFLVLQSPIRLDEGPIARSTSGGGPTTPKPDIIPKPQFPSPWVIREDFLP